MINNKANTVNVSKIERIKSRVQQEHENADLWYQNMVAEGRLDVTEGETALLWYEIMKGGI